MFDIKARKLHNSTKDVSLNMNGKKVGRIPALVCSSAVEQAKRAAGISKILVGTYNPYLIGTGLMYLPKIGGD